MELSPAALLLFSWLVYSASDRELAALFPAVLLHELGHLAAMGLVGCPPQRFRLEPSGLCLEYAGLPSPRAEALIALAGPATGLCYALAASLVSRRFGSETAALSAGLSLLLSLFNLLPIPPLDGGRTLQALWPESPWLRVLGLALAGALSLAGLYLCLRGKGLGLLSGGLFLLLNQRKHPVMLRC